MNMEHLRGSAMGLLESFSFGVAQYTLLGLSCLLGGIQSLLGAFSTYLRDKSEHFKELRSDKEEGKAADTPPDPEPDILEDSFGEEGFSGDQGEVLGEEPVGDDLDNQGVQTQEDCPGEGVCDDQGCPAHYSSSCMMATRN